MFEMHFRQESVVLMLGDEPVREVFETNSANRLMRKISECGRDGVRIRAIMTADGLADRRSINALNVFLRHSRGLQFFARCAQMPWQSRYGWREFRRFIGLRFVPLNG